MGSFCGKCHAFGNVIHFPSGEGRRSRLFACLSALANLVRPFPACLISSDILTKLVKGVRNPLRLVQEEGKFTVQSSFGTATVAESLATHPMDKWPDMPTMPTPTLTGEAAFKKSFREAMECSSTSDSRQVLNGACLDLTQPGCHSVGLNLDKDGAPEWVEFESDHWSFITKAIVGGFPNWRHVVPSEDRAVTTVTSARGIMTKRMDVRILADTAGFEAEAESALEGGAAEGFGGGGCALAALAFGGKEQRRMSMAFPLLAQEQERAHRQGHVSVLIAFAGADAQEHPSEAQENTVGKLITSPPEGTELVLLDGQVWRTNVFNGGGRGWTIPEMSLAPGQAALLHSSDDWNQLWVGRVREGEYEILVPAGGSLRGSPIPQSGRLSGLLQFPKVVGYADLQG